MSFYYGLKFQGPFIMVLNFKVLLLWFGISRSFYYGLVWWVHSTISCLISWNVFNEIQKDYDYEGIKISAFLGGAKPKYFHFLHDIKRITCF